MSGEEEFDAIVVGSGFGGSVATLRLAESGRSVCLLERGRSHPPGSFARTPRGFGTNLWDPSAGLFGLYDVWSFRKVDAVVSSGLGGGSLIYSNVLLPMNDRAAQGWVVRPGELAGQYEAAAEMLGATVYPFGQGPPWNTTPRTIALARAAVELGLEVVLPPLAITFGSAPSLPIGRPNLHGVARRTCRLVAECNAGCNDGSKNSLDLTYLTMAMSCPTPPAIRELCEATRIDRDGDAWRVHYIDRSTPPGPASDGRRVVRARLLVLAAGTFGTTYLLLKNRAALPDLSSRLGEGFSTNGDYLALLSSPTAAFDGSLGAVITTSVSSPVTRPDDPDFVIQDGGYPGLLDWVEESVLPLATLGRGGRILLRRLLQRWAGAPAPGRISADLAAVIGGARKSSGLLALSGTGVDKGGGRMYLQDGLLENSYDPDASAELYGAIRARLMQIAETLDARFHDSLSHRLSRAITVHPLGGCAMGESREHGVVNEFGQVFADRGVYPGLYIADGSVMPGPVGVNPSLTIAALAERFAAHMVASG